MGIKNFSKLAKRIDPTCIEIRDMQTFAGQKWAIDCSIYSYKFAHDPSSKKKNNPVIDGYYRFFHRLYSNGIQPILVLDGKKPKQKLYTIERRKKQTQNSLDKVHTLDKELMTMIASVHSSETPQILTSVPIDSIQNSPAKYVLKTSDIAGHKATIKQLMNEYKGHTEIEEKLSEIQSASKNIIQFGPDTYNQLMQLCQLMSVPVYQAEWEADALCTKLYREGQVQAVMSEDSDILLYNGSLIRKFEWKHNQVEFIDVDKLFHKMGITHQQFIDLAVLCGTDYTAETIDSLGYVTAINLIIQKKLTIEKIIENIKHEIKEYKKFTLPSESKDFDFIGVRQLINDAHSLEPNIDLSEIIWGPKNIDLTKLQEFMSTTCQSNLKLIEKHVNQMLMAPLTYEVKEKIKISMKPKNELPSSDTDKPKLTIKLKEPISDKPKLKIVMKPKLI